MRRGVVTPASHHLFPGTESAILIRIYAITFLVLPGLTGTGIITRLNFSQAVAPIGLDAMSQDPVAGIDT